MEPIEVIEKLGVTVGLLLLILFGGWKMCSLLYKQLFDPQNGILVKVANSFVDTNNKLQEAVDQMLTILNAHGNHLSELVELHNDPNSHFSTVKTNKGLIEQARVLEKLCNKQGIDVESEIKSIIEHLT